MSDRDHIERTDVVVTDEPWYRNPWVWVAVVALGLLLVLFVLWLAGGDDQDDLVVNPTPTLVTPTVEPTLPVTPTPGPTVTLEPTSTPPPGPRNTRAPEVQTAEGPPPQTLAGSGSQEAGTVEHEGGLAVLQLAHGGSGPFAVRLVDEGGAEVAVVSSDSPDYRGSRALGLDAGIYRVVVEADGRWGVDFRQPRYVDGLALPRQLRGRGDAATDPLEAPAGERRLSWQVDDGAAVGFRILSVDGEVVHDEEPSAAGEVTVRLDEGLYVLDVNSDAFWSIDVT